MRRIGSMNANNNPSHLNPNVNPSKMASRQPDAPNRPSEVCSQGDFLAFKIETERQFAELRGEIARLSRAAQAAQSQLNSQGL